MRVAVKKLGGIDSLDVSLNRGMAFVRFKPDNRITVEQLREAVRANGFTPKSAEVRIQGRVIEADGKLALALPPEDEVYPLVDHEEASGASQRLRAAALGQVVVIDGTVPETTRRDASTTVIRVRAFAVTHP